MPTLANDLVQFLMHLFGNRKAIQAFLDDPERALSEHGLGNVCLADVDAAMPVVLDYAPITVNAPSFEREYNTGAGNVWAGAAAPAGHAVGASAVHSGSQGAAHGGRNYDQDDHAHAVQQLHHVVNHFSYTASTTMVDDRDTVTDQSVSQNIWADGDVEQWFDNDAVVAAGDHAVAAGDDADLQDSNNIRDSYNTDRSVDESTDDSIHAGGDVNIGNEETDIADSFNTDLDLDDSFNDNSDNSDNSDHSDNSVSTDTDLDLRDSFNDNSDNSTQNTVEVEDSFNQDSSTTTVLEDSFNQDNSNTTAVDIDVEVEDSFQDNSATSNVEDSVVVADNQLDFTEDNSSHTDIDLDNDTTIDDSVVDDSTVL
jgi:hypothetical protein